MTNELLFGKAITLCKLFINLNVLITTQNDERTNKSTVLFGAIFLFIKYLV